MHPTTHGHGFRPAAGLPHLLGLYDPLTRLLGKGRLDAGLVRQAGLQPGHRVLDLGCGTGAVSAAAARTAPDAVVHGVDPDPAALGRARRAADRAGVQVTWEEGNAQSLPYPDASFDRVLSSFMFHHVPEADRPAALAEVLRVLAPGGQLHLVDFGDGSADQLRAAGFDAVAVTGSHRAALLGTVTRCRGDRRAS